MRVNREHIFEEQEIISFYELQFDYVMTTSKIFIYDYNVVQIDVQRLI